MRNLAYQNGFAPQALGQALGESALSKKTIPFDYVFQFPLQGKRGNKVQDVVEISVEGMFVALSLGYSVVLDELGISSHFQPVLDQTTLLQNPTLVPFPSGPPDFDDSQARNLEGLLVSGLPGSEIVIVEFTLTNQPTPLKIIGKAVIGSAGKATIDFTPPLAFGVIRGWDRTNNLLSEMIEIGPATITPQIGPHHQTQRLPSAGDEVVEVYGSPNDTINLFISEAGADSFSQVNGSVDLQEDLISFGRRIGRAELRLNKKLAPGDVLNVRSTSQIGLAFSMFAVPRIKPSTITLGALAAGLESIGADLTGGFRFNPNFANLVTTDLPLDQLTQETRNKIFQAGSVAAEEVSFLYSLDVSGTGREYQNKPIHNIAGLGIANGDRPFRPFAKPVAFEPKSSIRIQIEELAGPPGTLFIVLQGYKILGASRLRR